jgi:hypothetical protein
MMFTINIYVKFALIAVLLLGGIGLSFVYGIGYTWIMILAGLILLASYFILGTINSTGAKFQAMDIAGAEKQLALTYFPNLLYGPIKGIYYLLKGSIAAQKKDNKAAEESLTYALTLDMPSDNEKAMIYMQLVGIHMGKQNWPGAQAYLSQLKKLNITERMIKDQIGEMDKAMASRGNINLARSMGKAGMQQMARMGGGSKKRRPLGR